MSELVEKIPSWMGVRQGREDQTTGMIMDVVNSVLFGDRDVLVVCGRAGHFTAMRGRVLAGMREAGFTPASSSRAWVDFGDAKVTFTAAHEDPRAVLSQFQRGCLVFLDNYVVEQEPALTEHWASVVVRLGEKFSVAAYREVKDG